MMTNNTTAKQQVLKVISPLKRFDVNQVNSMAPDLWLSEVRTALRTLLKDGVIKVVAKRKPVKIIGVTGNGRKLNVYEVIE